MHASSLEASGEDGEEEMEEGEYEWEEGESELEESASEEEASSSNEPAPALIPIESESSAKVKLQKQPVAEKGKARLAEPADESEDSSDYDSSEEDSLDSDMDTEELEELEAEQEKARSNSHGFVYSADLNTYRLSKKERIEAQEAEATGKKKFLSSAAKRRAKKNSGTTNVEKLKNKPMTMLLPKKVEMRNEKRDAKMRSIRKSELKQLGKFTKNTKQRIDAKKKPRIS